MPNRNGTGPESEGALTGRKLGNCRSPQSTSEEVVERRGWGNRRGLGKGNRRRQHGNSNL